MMANDSELGLCFSPLCSADSGDDEQDGCRKQHLQMWCKAVH